MYKCGDDETRVVFMNHDCSWATDVNLNYCPSMQADNRWTLSLTDATYEQMFAGGTGGLGATSWIHWSTLFLNSFCKNWWRQRCKLVAGMRERACPLAIWPFPPRRHQKSIMVKRESGYKNILKWRAQFCTMMTALNLTKSQLFIIDGSFSDIVPEKTNKPNQVTTLCEPVCVLCICSLHETWRHRRQESTTPPDVDDPPGIYCRIR